MSNFAILEEEISRLTKEKEELIRVMENELHYRDIKIRKYREDMMNCYPNFFKKKNNKNFEFIHDFPTKKEVQIYEESGDFAHPLASYGDFSIKELAEVIKLLFSYQKQEEYKIITFGTMTPESHIKPNYPALFLLIGNEKSLADYYFLNGTFQGDLEKNLAIIQSKKIPNLIALQARESYEENTLGICCNIDRVTDNKKEGIHYYHDWLQIPCCSFYSECFNIFNNCLTNFSSYEGIQDTLSFKVHIEDKFLAEMLLSIAIYKKNNGLIYQQNQDVKDLMDGHYQEIFKILFNEDNIENIQKMVKKDIPKTLRYIKKNNE